VVMDSGLPLTPGASVIRNLLRAADFLPFLYAAGAACMLLRADFKRLGDIAAGTLVVYAESVRLHGEVPAAEPLAWRARWRCASRSRSSRGPAAPRASRPNGWRNLRTWRRR
jgi:hypothetical protein